MSSRTGNGRGAVNDRAGEGSSSPSPDDMDLARRLDWRFVLPEPTLGRVAYAGPSDSMLAQALRRFSSDFVPVPDPGPGGEEHGADPARAGDCDLAVVASRRIENLREATRKLRAGGHLYWEVNRYPGSGSEQRVERGDGERVGGLLRDPGSTLQVLGLEEVRVHCDFPGFHNPRVMLSPDPASIRYVTEMRGKRFFGLEHGIGLAARIGALPRIAPWLAVIARRPGGKPAPEGVAASAFLGGRVAGWELDRVPWVVLAPPLSWFLITIFLIPGSGRPLAVVKAIRMSEDPRATEAMNREIRGLRFARQAPLPDPDSVPLIMATGVHGGARSVAQSAASGRVLTRKEVRKRPEYWTDRVAEWLIEVHRATRHRGAENGRRLVRLLERPVRELRDHLPASGPDASLGARTGQMLRILGRLELPCVLEHGDLWGSNILIGREDRISVVDWEWAEPHGLPGRDLFFFLAFVAMTRERADSPEARLEAFRRAFRGPGGWARPWIAAYWNELRLPLEAASALFASCWSRHVRRLVRRPDGILAPEKDLRDGLQQHHYFTFWKEIVGPSGSPEEPYAQLTTIGEPR